MDLAKVCVSQYIRGQDINNYCPLNVVIVVSIRQISLGLLFHLHKEPIHLHLLFLCPHCIHIRDILLMYM